MEAVGELFARHHARFRTVHHRVLLCIIGAQRKRPDHRMISYNHALKMTGCKSIEATLHTRILLWAGVPIRVGGGQMPKTVYW